MKNRKLLSVFAIALLSLGVASCGGGSNPTSAPVDPTTGADPTTAAPTSSADPTTSTAKVIEAIVISDEFKNITTTVGDILYDFTDYYTVKPSGLSSKQRRVEVTIVSGQECFEEDDGMFEAVLPGQATFQITSKVNPDIFDTMTVTVNDAYFERNSVADLTHELPENGGYITTNSLMTTDIYIKETPSTKFYYETTISFSETLNTEYWPKIGLRVESTDTADYASNAFVYFFDFPVTKEEYADGSYYTKEWTNFGLCEISKGEGWAWNPGINNATARHNDCIYSLETPVKANDEFSMGMARDGADYYLFANGKMICKFNPLADLLPADCPTKFGFFEFNSNTRFSNYSHTIDSAEVDAKIADYKDVAPLETWADD